MAPLINSKDPKLKRQVLSCLGQIAKHSVELAELVIEGEVIATTLERLKDTDQFVRKNAATLIRELTKNSPEASCIMVYKRVTAHNDRIRLQHLSLRRVELSKLLIM